jgi:hypothetical protein
MFVSATRALDTLVMIDGERLIGKAVANSDFVLGLSAGWTDAEFNVFGFCCRSQAIFNDGSTMDVQLIVDHGTLAAPACVNQSFTAESNSLTLVEAGPNVTIQAWPQIRFTQSNVAPLKMQNCISGGGTGLNSNVVYRWLDQSNGDHFYTLDPSGELAPSIGYLFENMPFSVFDQNTPGTVAFNRWLCPSGHHFYTTDPTGEKASGVCQPEGALGFIATSQIPGTVPLFRWYNAGADDHFYTTDDRGELAPSTGYVFEMIAGYVKLTK